jgi:hypothetical protein
MEEVWKDIEGYEGKYQVSNTGLVINLSFRGSGNIRLTPQSNHKGYRRVKLGKNNLLVHRLVAQEFITNPDNLPNVLHIDDNPENNKVTNLKWGTQKDNILDMESKGRGIHPRGVDQKQAKLTEEDIRMIRKLRQETGEGCRKISRKLGLPVGPVSHVISGRRWKHIK